MIKTMNNLVITVSLDSSIELLKQYADIVLLDADETPVNTETYDTVYIRSHFSHPETAPQNFRTEIERIVQNTARKNQHVQFIDDMDTVDKILSFENKWHQYKLFSEFMPHTELLNSKLNASGFTKPVFKKVLSSRGNAVTWNESEVTGRNSEWIAQESLDIREELRVDVIGGDVYPIGAVRRSMTDTQKVKAIGVRELTKDEIEFAQTVSAKVPTLDMIGLDIALTSDGNLRLIEVNRSPGFAAFATLTGVNLASVLYKHVALYR